MSSVLRQSSLHGFLNLPSELLTDTQNDLSLNSNDQPHPASSSRKRLKRMVAAEVVMDPHQTENIPEPETTEPRKSARIKEKALAEVTIPPNMKVHSMFLTKEQKVAEARAAELEKWKRENLERHKELARLVGVSEDRKLCPVFVKGSSVPDSEKSQSSTESVLPGIDPILDFHHYPREALQGEFSYWNNLNSLFPSILKPLSVIPDSIQSFLLLPSTKSPNISRPSSPSNPSDLFQFTVDSKLLRNQHELIKSNRLPPRCLSDWLTCRFNQSSYDAKKLFKFLHSWSGSSSNPEKRKKLDPCVFLKGPISSGKTSLVYALAAELNIQVLEISSSDLSFENPTKLDSLVKEALQSKQFDCGDQLLLIEDFDVCLKIDKTLINQLQSLCQGAKRPIIITTTEEVPVEANVLEIDQIPYEAILGYVSSMFSITPELTAEIMNAVSKTDLRKIVNFMHLLPKVESKAISSYLRCKDDEKCDLPDIHESGRLGIDYLILLDRAESLLPSEDYIKIQVAFIGLGSDQKTSAGSMTTTCTEASGMSYLEVARSLYKECAARNLNRKVLADILGVYGILLNETENRRKCKKLIDRLDNIQLPIYYI
jgi:ATPase family associated with various cellular activities (AAA)